MLMNNISRKQLEFAGGKGSSLVTADGRWYLDLFADVGTASLGYSSETQRAALRAAVDVPIHAPNLFQFRDRTLAAKRLTEATGMHSAFFCNSGTEAAEAAIKLARFYKFKTHTDAHDLAPIGIASVKGGFHGRTYGSLAAGDGPMHHYRGFGDMPRGFYKFEPPNHTDLDPSNLAAVMLAPVFGNGDIIEYPESWLRALKLWCVKHDLLLIFDEVQTGAGRCGHYTYAQRIGIQPDIICMAKGLAMGMPVGACLAREGLDFEPGTHFSTFGGNPLCSVMVNGMLDWLSGRMEWIQARGNRLRAGLRAFPWAKNIRGPGMLLAFDFAGDCMELANNALEEQLIIGVFRSGPGPVKITPPLNMSDPEMDMAIDRLGKAAKRMGL